VAGGSRGTVVILWMIATRPVLFVYEISPEPLNGFAPNSQERRVFGPSLGRI